MKMVTKEAPSKRLNGGEEIEVIFIEELCKILMTFKNISFSCRPVINMIVVSLFDRFHYQ
jgi:hypothetical protein